MKKLNLVWKKRSFAQQLAIVFISIFLLQFLVVQGVGAFYTNHILEQKIEESFAQILQQTTQNIDATLFSYKDLIEQIMIDNAFIRNVKLLDTAEGDELQKVKGSLEDEMKDFMTYQSDVRCVSIETVGGQIYSYDKTQNDSWNQPLPKLHQQYYEKEVFDNTVAIKGIWMPTEFLDRQGTQEYYVYSFGKNIYDWYINKYVGTCTVSINERVLSRICEDARISEDYGTNYICIVGKDGRIISHYNKDFIGQEAAKALQTSERYLSFTNTMETTGWTVVSVLNRDYIYKSLLEMQNFTMGISVVLGILVIFGVFFVSGKMTRYVKDIVHTMNEVEDGKLSVQVGVNKDEKNEISIIANQFNRMMEKINEQMEETKEAGIREKEAEMRALEAQINPHFIYNTLDSINWLAIENRQTEISNMLSQFARILRYQIQKSNTMVTIREEIEYLERYLFLQKSRFLDSFEYVLECQESVRDCKINKMIFQPFVENAILHGCADLDHGGLLKIQIRGFEEEQVIFTVSDNGSGMSEEQIDKIFVKRENPGNSIGVLNVLARLDMYYGDSYSIRVHSALQEGTVIETIFPKNVTREE